MSRSFVLGSLSAAVLLLGLSGGQASAQYSSTLSNTYVGQQYFNYCGAATAAMILNSSTVGLTTLSADGVYSQIQTYNAAAGTAAGNYYTSPAGLQGTLSVDDPYNVSGHTYVAYNLPNFNTSTLTLAYNVDHYQIPAGALINNGAHWVTIYGVNASAQPSTSGGFTVNGFYIEDPWSGYKPGQGLGKNAYIANTAAGWQRIFTPTKYGGIYQGNYAFVADPDPGEPDTVSYPPAGTNPVTTGSGALTAALSDLEGISGLAGDASFENGAVQFQRRRLVTLPGGFNDWLVPYDEGSNTSGVAMIDEATGSLDAAYWDEGVLSGDSLTYFENNLSGPEDLVIDNVVPEPSTFMLLGAASMAFVMRMLMKRGRRT